MGSSQWGELEAFAEQAGEGPGAFRVCLDTERCFVFVSFWGAGVISSLWPCLLFRLPFILSSFFLRPFLPPARPWMKHSGFRDDLVEISALRSV